LEYICRLVAVGGVSLFPARDMTVKLPHLK
jgi:hypothetical protein